MSESKTLVRASTKPFEGMGAVQVVAEMRRMQRDKGKSTDTPAKRPALDETLKRINRESRQELSPEAKAALDERNAREMEAQRLEQAQKRASTLWNDSNVPLRHAENKALHGDQWREAAVKARDRIANQGHIALIGGFGTGKTQIAVEMIREATTNGHSALFVTATQLLREIKACYRDETKTTETEVVARYVRPSLLVIDEFHRRKGSDWENEQLFDIVNRRYDALKALIVICNQSRQEFDAAMDGAILDRMNETGGIIECNWESFRQ